MKASKIRIVVILLLIIFFGLLILFGSRNIYEGIKMTTKQTGPVGGTAPQGSKSTIYKPNTKTTTFASTDLITVKQTKEPSNIDKDSYFMKVYYYLPKTEEYSATKNYPISYIHHNLPSCLKVSFTNTEPEGFGPSTEYNNIFIQGPSGWDKKISKCYKEGLNSDATHQSYTFEKLHDDINNKNNRKPNIAIDKSNLSVVNINKKELVIDVPKNSNEGKGTKNSEKGAPLNLPSNLLEYKPITQNMEGIKFNGTYDQYFKVNSVLALNRGNVAGKSINLVTFYLNFKSLPKSCE